MSQDSNARTDERTQRSADVEIEKIFEAFQSEKLPAVKVTLFYKLGLVLVALMMVLLCLTYIGAIAGVIYWVYLALFMDSRDFLIQVGFKKDGWVVISGIAGIITGFFLIKPIFAKQAKPPAPLELVKGEQPVLERFVHRIADSVGAPRPRSIEVDCNANAGAAFRRGIGSMFGSDLKLVIGLPLVAGMDLRSLGGVLAHEFGHFAQGTGMRLTYLIRSVNAWFARVVFERDAWDMRLVRWSKSLDIRLMVFLYAVRIFIWLTRSLLWILMHIGHGISCFAMRQMEFDADYYEVQFAGSDSFAKTSQRLRLLSLGGAKANSVLEENWEHRRLARNLP